MKETLPGHLPAGHDSEWAQVEDARMSWLLQAAPDATAIVNAAGRIITLNSQWEELFGYGREELVGQSVDFLVPERFRRSHASYRLTYADDPRPRPMGFGRDLYAKRKDGSEFAAEISLSSLVTPDGMLISVAVRDISERHKAEEARFQLAAIVDGSDDAIVGCTLAGIITSWNQSAELVFGYSSDQAVGRPLTMLLPVGHEHEVDEQLAQLLSGARVQLHDAVRRHRDGHDLDVSISMSAVRDRAGVLVGASKVIRDISDRRHAEAALAAAKEAAEISSQAFEAFSYSVAHDLRAPLRAIDGFSEALAGEYADLLDLPGREYLTRIRGSVRRMAQLIDSLLALARVTHRDMEARPINLSEMALTAADRLRQQYPDHPMEVVIERALVAYGDPVLLADAIENLLSNAWKFTTSASPPRVEFGRSHGRYFVRDNGAGFDMRYSDKLFGVFQRLHNEAEFPGTGIGLATVQRVVRRHGGRIWAESVVGEGATFYFTLSEALP